MNKKHLQLFLLFLILFAFRSLSAAESILVISDTHLTKETQRHAAMMEAVIQAAKGKDLVLMTGDNTDNTRMEEHALVLQWAQIIEQQTGAKVYIIPGNHDYGAYFGPEQFIDSYEAYGWDLAFSRDTYTASCAVMTSKGTCLLLLDSNRPDLDRSFLPDGRIEDSTLQWARNVLESLPDGTPVIACGHHPILPKDRDKRTPGAYSLSQLFRSYGVSLYLCGHDHGFATVEEDGLRQITIGQPQAYPGWAGCVEIEEDAFLWHVEQIYEEHSSAYIHLQENAYNLSRDMARGTLKSTPYADDEDAITWFSEVFMLSLNGNMTSDAQDQLLSDNNYQKWRQVETKTVVKDWILNLLEHPTDLKELYIPSPGKHAQSLKKAPPVWTTPDGIRCYVLRLRSQK